MTVTMAHQPSPFSKLMHAFKSVSLRGKWTGSHSGRGVTEDAIPKLPGVRGAKSADKREEKDQIGKRIGEGLPRPTRSASDFSVD
jgi:hypothetical protein